MAPPGKQRKEKAPKAKQLAPTSVESGSASGPQRHPLLIEEVVDHLFSFLGEDLTACYDVCKLWRSLVPPHNIRYRAFRPPVLIKGDMIERGGGFEYLTSIRKHPSFKAAKFVFRNTVLNSKMVEELVKENGMEVEELELFYENYNYYNSKGHKVPLSIAALGELLKNKMPNLRNLIITALPNQVQGAEADLFPTTAEGTAVDTTLALKRVEITTNCEFGFYHNYQPYPPFSATFLTGLFTASPQLEEIKLTEWRSRQHAGFIATIVICSLRRANRLAQIRKLEFDVGDPSLLLTHLVLSQCSLKSFSISKAVYPRPPMYGNIRPIQDPSIVRDFLAAQAVSLEHLELPIARIARFSPFRPADELAPPVPIMAPMPNLLELKLINSDDDGPRPPGSEPVSLQGALRYATNFPRLRVLGLKGLLQNYVEDEIFPAFSPPCETVEVLQEIPLGVNEGLMARIGRLFPNLAIIRTPVASGCERLVSSIWEFCPNITELLLTFEGDREKQKEDSKDKDAVEVESLDCLFSGIPETECKRLRALSGKVQVQELAKLDFEGLRAAAGTKSITNLKGLKRLIIDGPAITLGGGGQVPYAVREDKLSAVFALSILGEAGLGRKLPELVFFQARVEMAELSQASISAVCDKSGLEHVVPKLNPESCSKIVRLIRPGIGLEGLGAIPKGWFGLSSFRGGGDGEH